jgi:glutathione synthase
MNTLFVTDPLSGLQAEVDATVGLMTATESLGAAVWVCCPEDLEVIAGRLHARARRISIRPTRPNGDHRWLVEPVWWAEVDARTLDVATEVDLVQLRIDPPVDARYLHTTYLLDLAEAAGVPVVNRPQGIRALHEKLGALAFPELCPETVVSADPRVVRDFISAVGGAVVKPVDGFAGMDVWLVRDDETATALAESATRLGTRHVIAQAYLADVEAGNKRVFVLDGEIVGTVLRRPAEGDFRIGPPVVAVEADEDDRRIVDVLAPVLAGHGIVLAGLDVIAGRLIEVNVTCPGGMHKTDALLGTDLSGAIMRRLLESRPSRPERLLA